MYERVSLRLPRNCNLFSTRSSATRENGIGVQRLTLVRANSTRSVPRPFSTRNGRRDVKRMHGSKPPVQSLCQAENFNLG